MAAAKLLPTPTALTDEWRQLIKELSDELEEPEKERILFYYDTTEPMDTDEGELKPEQKDFHDIIDGEEDKLAAAYRLEKVLKNLRLHSSLGESLADVTQRYINRLKGYLEQFEIEKKTVFIGRKEELRLIQELLIQEKDTIGVTICGLGGQGKTSLARQVCWTLGRIKSPCWWVQRADLRNLFRTTEVVQSLLVAFKAECPLQANQTQLENILKQCIANQNGNIVFWLDDCDQVVKCDGQKFCAFIHSLDQITKENKHKVRFLMTMRERIAEAKIIETKKQRGISYIKKEIMSGEGRYFVEIELDALDSLDAIELLRSCSQPVSVEEERVAEAIVKECAYSPLGITVISELLRNGKFTPEKLLFHLKMDRKNVTKALRVDVCLREAIDQLSPLHQKALVALSVFQSSPFNSRAARKVLETCVDKALCEADRDYMKLLTGCLESLYNHHLIEVEGDWQAISVKGDLTARQSSQELKTRRIKNKFSLHPLVFRHVSEWKKPKELQVTYENAIKAFVAHYEEVISEVVKQLETRYWRGHRLLQTNKVHILRFYDILDEHTEWLGKHERRTSDPGVYRKKRLSDLADILLPIVKNRRIFQNEADRANKAGNDGMYVFWMVEKADVFVMLHDKVEIAIKILDDLSNGKYASLRGFHDEPFYPTLVHALFHKVKGLCRWKQNQHDEALKHLHLALTFYEKCKQPEMYNSFIARLQCYMGQVHLDLGDLDRADDLLHKGHLLVKGMVDCRHEDANELAKELHWDIPRYYNHFAVVKLRQAKTEEDVDKRNQLLDTALEDLEKGIRLDEQLRMNYLDGYYTKFKLRADVNIEKDLLDEALRDAMYALDNRRRILQPPHTHYTESVYQVARIYMLQGDKLERSGDIEAARKHWRCSDDYFEEVRDCHLKEGGLSLSNPVYQEIKRDHLKVNKLMKGPDGQRKLAKFYQDLEKGRYESKRAESQRSIIQMIYTPVEMIKKMVGGGGKEFGDQEKKLEKIENLARLQHERMERGEPCGGERKDSGRGHSSSEFEDSSSSGSGSMTAQLRRMQFEQSASFEDSVFEEEPKGELLNEPTSSEGKTKTAPPRKKKKYESEPDV